MHGCTRSAGCAVIHIGSSVPPSMAQASGHEARLSLLPLSFCRSFVRLDMHPRVSESLTSPRPPLPLHSLGQGRIYLAAAVNPNGYAQRTRTVDLCSLSTNRAAGKCGRRPLCHLSLGRSLIRPFDRPSRPLISPLEMMDRPLWAPRSHPSAAWFV